MGAWVKAAELGEQSRGMEREREREREMEKIKVERRWFGG